MEFEAVKEHPHAWQTVTDSKPALRGIRAGVGPHKVTPLVRRDPKAEAVVKAAVQVKAAWDLPTAKWSRAVDVLGEAVDALLAARKKAKR